MAARRRKTLAARLRAKRGILLDISFGGKPQARAVTLGPHGDIAQDPRAVPFKLPAKSVHTAVVTHVLEFVPAGQWFAWWDELHRVMQDRGVVYFSGPYGGDDSQGWVSDPTHVTRVVEQSFAWLDPRLPFFALHESLGRTPPKPWWTQAVARVPGAHGTVSYNATMQKAVR